MDSNFEVDFWRQDVNDYVWADGSSSISQFTASMWIKNSSVYPFTLFSFGTLPIKIQFYMQSEDRTNLCIWLNSNRHCRYVSFSYHVYLLSPNLLPRGNTPKFLVFLCDTNLETGIIFEAKICDFFTSYFSRERKIDTPFYTSKLHTRLYYMTTPNQKCLKHLRMVTKFLMVMQEIIPDKQNIQSQKHFISDQRPQILCQFLDLKCSKIYPLGPHITIWPWKRLWLLIVVDKMQL